MTELLALPGLRQLADVVLIGLLGATLAYVRRLERNLDRLRGDRAAFERMLDTFAERTRTAEDALERFQNRSDGINRELAAQIAVASALRHELADAAARAEACGRMQDAPPVFAEPVRAVPAPAPVAAPTPKPASMPMPMPVVAPVGAPVPVREAALRFGNADAPAGRPRSRAERDLLHALRGMR